MAFLIENVEKIAAFVVIFAEGGSAVSHGAVRVAHVVLIVFRKVSRK